MAELPAIEFTVWLVPNRPDITCWADAEAHASDIGFVTVHPELIPPGHTAVEWAQELMATRTPDIRY